MIDREKLEHEVADLIRENTGICYSFKDGKIDGETLFITGVGAAHVVVHHVLTVVRAERLAKCARSQPLSQPEYPADHPAPGDLGSVPL